jgi:hypothetical protein
MAEAWLRKKPKRVIHNQNLIILLLGESLPAAMLIVFMVFWLTTIFPWTILYALIGWAVLTATYIAFKIYIRITRKHGY